MAKTTTHFPVSCEGIYTPPAPGESHPRVIGMPVGIWYVKNTRGVVKQSHVACVKKVEVDGIEKKILAVSFAKTSTDDIIANKACKASGRTMASVRLAKAIKKGFIDNNGRPIIHSMIGLWLVKDVDDDIELELLTPPTSIFTEYYIDGDLVDPLDAYYMKASGTKMDGFPARRRAWVDMPPEHRLKAVAHRLGR